MKHKISYSFIGLIFLFFSIDCFSQNIKKADPVPEDKYYIEIADNLFQQGNYHAAAYYYEQAIGADSLNVDSTNHYPIYQAGQCYRIKRLYPPAEKWYGIIARYNYEHWKEIDLHDSLSAEYDAYAKIYKKKSTDNYEKAISNRSKYEYYDSLAKSFDAKSVAFTQKAKISDSIVNAHKVVYLEQYPMAMFNYALMQKANGKYNEARESFVAFANMYQGNNVHIKSRVRQEIHGMDFANAWIEYKYPYDIELLSTAVNDTFSDFSPVKLNENTLLFSGTYQMEDKKKVKVIKANARKQNITFSPYLNRIFISEKLEDSAWSKRKVLKLDMNKEITHIGNPSPSNNGQRLYFTVCERLKLASEFKESCQIYYTDKGEDSVWGEAKLVGFGVNLDSTSSKNPFVYHDVGDKADREIMFFSSNRKGGTGGYDLYYSVLNTEIGSIIERGEGKATNLGNKINTYYDEVTPFFDPAANTLYFSSNGHLGLGEHDIFKAHGTRVTGWDRPENLGYPINSGADDYYYYQNKETDEIFFASNRLGGILLTESTCCDDIYNIPSTNLVWGRYYAKGKAVEDIGNGIKVPLKGLAINLYYIDTATYARVLIGKDTLSKLSETPDFIVELNPNETYMIEVTKPGFLMNKLDFNTFNLKSNDTLQLDDIVLKRIKVGDKFVVDHIFYDLNKATLRQESYVALDNLLTFMYENPGLKIELSAHTDSRGSESYNQELSQRRAESVTKYLQLNGIKPYRMQSTGYGETRLVNRCKDGVECTEDEHQLNRRTEVEVLEYDTTITDELFSRKVKTDIQEEGFNLNDEKFKDKVVYLIQVGVYDTDDPLKVARLLNLGNISTEPVGNGLFRFFLGPYTTKKEADEVNAEVESRVKGSRLVPLFNGQKITMQKAFRIENDQ